MPCSYVTVMWAAAEWLHAGCCSAAVMFIRRWWCQQQACSTPSVDREAEMKCEYCWKVGNSRGFKPGLAKMTMVFIGQHKKWPPLSAAAWHTFGPRYWFRFQIAARRLQGSSFASQIRIWYQSQSRGRKLGKYKDSRKLSCLPREIFFPLWSAICAH